MSGGFEPTQARNNWRKVVWDRYLVDLGHRMAICGYFQGFPSVLQI